MTGVQTCALPIYKKICFAITGKLDLPQDRIADLGVQQVIAIADQETSDSEAMQNAFPLLKQRAIRYPMDPFPPKMIWRGYAILLTLWPLQSVGRAYAWLRQVDTIGNGSKAKQKNFSTLTL